MEKKTSRLVYVILGMGIVLAVALVPFAAVRRKVFLAEGDAVMADFSVGMGIFGGSCALLFAGIIFLLLLKDRRAERKQLAFSQELAQTPMFERWFLQEEEQIKKLLTPSRILTGIMTIPLVYFTGQALILVMDGGRVFEGVVVLFCIFVLCFIWWLSDYRIQYMRSFLRSLSAQLPTLSDRETFAKQISGEETKHFSYLSGPQTVRATAWVATEFCWFRQFRRCRILKNRDIDRVVLKKVSYTIGLRPHFRTCFCMEIYIHGSGRGWCGYFHRQEEIYGALKVFRNGGIPEEKIENELR